MVTNPTASVLNDECSIWLESQIAGGVGIVVPEIADFEVRRELLRINKTAGLRQLNALKTAIGVTYLPITTEAMLRAAAFWAEARRRGRPTADPHALDCDVILVAQANLLADDGNDVIIATTNVGHLAQFVQADHWRSIAVPS
jgi:hypothetical protein